MPVKKKDTKEEENKIYDEYFTYTNELKIQYGDRSLVLMLVGAFFEVYGLQDVETEEITKSNLLDFITICNLNMSVKMELPKLNNEGHRSVILMAGVRDYN